MKGVLGILGVIALGYVAMYVAMIVYVWFAGL